MRELWFIINLRIKICFAPFDSAFLNSSTWHESFIDFLQPWGVFSMCRHLCGWNQTIWPLTSLWLSHLSVAGATPAPDPILDFIPGEILTTICCHVSSLSFSFSHTFCFFLSSFQNLCLGNFQAELKHFTAPCRNKCACSGLSDQGIKNHQCPHYSVSPATLTTVTENNETDFHGSKWLFHRPSSQMRPQFRAPTAGEPREMLIDLLQKCSCIVFVLFSSVTPENPVKMEQRGDDRWKRESPEKEINMLSERMKTFYRQMNKYINLTVKQQKLVFLL